MFIYEKKLQFPVKISTPNPKLAAVIISQYGGPPGEIGASLRYLSQRYAMPILIVVLYVLPTVFGIALLGMYFDVTLQPVYRLLVRFALGW